MAREEHRPVAYAQRIGWRWAVFYAVREQDERDDIGVRFWLRSSAHAQAWAIDRAYGRGRWDEYVEESA